MKAIGIDIGTTTISGVVLDVAKRQVLEARTVQNGSFIKTEHEWERIQDVDVILDKAADLVKELLACCPEAGAIGLTGQMHGIVYLDRKGRHISPLYTWQDGRGNLSSDGHKPLTEQVMDKTGVFIASGYGLISHLYNLRNGLVPQEAVSLCTIGDYLGMVLTGRKYPLVHISNAASLGFFDVQRGGFREDAMKEMGIDPSILPEITEDFTELGRYQGMALMVTHDRDEAYQICEYLLLMERGRIIGKGRTKELFQNPGTVKAAVLTGCKNISRIIPINEHRVKAVEWNQELEVGQRVDESVTHIGIRAHDMIPADGWKEGTDSRGNNMVRTGTARVSEMPFEWYVTLENGLWWKKGKQAGEYSHEFHLPEALYVPKEAILLLRDSNIPDDGGNAR